MHPYSSIRVHDQLLISSWFSYSTHHDGSSMASLPTNHPRYTELNHGLPGWIVPPFLALYLILHWNLLVGTLSLWRSLFACFHHGVRIMATAGLPVACLHTVIGTALSLCSLSDSMVGGGMHGQTVVENGTVYHLT
ncbi:hypothetical protein BDV96DRAFT_80555 [Lophiotrema nucula]|uniref:Uncharacterized protein n=1 Tax=Lophiotrema nucula TaxID=690887 RepID=A0A6A5Z7T7_9PLEO|nr:hypothetical protein BDV96DRAFT_80555 [Lophiotrema nucula]